ncbi:MAG: hypothetical protein HKN50_08155 [Gammaproteobacteria bacterium]|nr:hypothetical protein [Gammaproteobacteria bacterium]
MRTLSILLISTLVGCSEPYAPTPIESAPSGAPHEIAAGFTPRGVQFSVEPHPFMSAQGVNSMHSDGYSSDVHPVKGPLGKNLQINTRVGSRMPGGQCATLTFASNGDLLALCAAITGFRLHRLSPRTLNLLAEYDMPTRPSSWEALISRQRSKIMEDSSGAYFYLDQHDRIVMADADKIVHRIASRKNSDGEWEFYSEASWDLDAHVPDDCLRPSNWFPDGECDLITAVMPDFEGRLWWATRAGRVGTIDQDSGAIWALQLEGEEIQNGFSVARDGVYIVSDHAMYGFTAAANGEPQVRWREQYDRGSSRRVGTINQGSGTTPTLMGDDYVTITDNADGRMNLLVYRRRGGTEVSQRLVCAVPIFDDGHSVTDNSMIATARSILLENNAGYTNSVDQTDWTNAGGGIVRVDVRADESGCDVMWESAEASPSVVPKLAAETGVAYFYTYEHGDTGVNDWYLMGLDFHSGKTLFKLYTGSGPNFDNNWSPITLAPDGTAYVGTSKGLVALWDGE